MKLLLTSAGLTNQAIIQGLADLVHLFLLPPMLSPAAKNGYLMSWINKSVLKTLLPAWLKTKIYVGLSAGSCIAAPWWLDKHDAEFYDMPDKYDKYDCLGLVNFYIMPHLNSPYFPNARLPRIAQLAPEIKTPVYALDDNSAVKVDANKIEVISTGQWQKFN